MQRATSTPFRARASIEKTELRWPADVSAVARSPFSGNQPAQMLQRVRNSPFDLRGQV